MRDDRIDILGEIIDLMKNREGGSLKGMLDESKKPVMEELETPPEESLKEPGISIEKVSLEGKQKIPGVNMGRHHRIAAPGPKDPELKAMVDKKSGGGVGPESPEGESEMSEDELKELLSKYGI